MNSGNIPLTMAVYGDGWSLRVGRRLRAGFPTHDEAPLMDPEDLQKLVSQTMPYGKYKDRVIADLPAHYLAWYVRTGLPKGQIGRLLGLMHEIDHNNLRALLKPLRPVRP